MAGKGDYGFRFKGHAGYRLRLLKKIIFKLSKKAL